MGKQKRQRGRPHKENPTGLMSVKDFDEIEDSTKGNKESTLQYLYDEIQSCNMEEKLSALHTLETMAWDASIARQIAKDGITKLAGPLLLDSKDMIRAAAAAAFKQIAENGGDQARTNLIDDDIMTPLTALMKQHYSNCLFNSDHKNVKYLRETYIEAVSLLWTLCENNENAINFINEQELVSILIKYLDINIYDMPIIITTIQFLITVIEDNSIAIEQIKSSEENLHDILAKMVAKNAKSSPEAWFARISSISLLTNICAWDDICKSKYFNVFIKTLDEVFSFDNKQLLSSLVSILPHEKNAESKNNRKKVLESKMLLNTQQLALEILMNLESNNDDEDDESLSVDGSEKMEVESNEMEADEASENLKRSLPVHLVEALNHYNIIGKIWEKTVAVDTDSQEILDQTVEGKNVLKQFSVVRQRAYFCLNNILPNFDIDALGGVNNLYSKWLEIGNAVIKEISPNEKELLEAAVHAMRAIVERLNDMQTDVFTQLSEPDFEIILMCDMQTRCADASVRVNMIRILGNVALNLTRNITRTYTMTKKLAEIILNDCSIQTQAWLLAESIDAIMDLFADDETDRLAADIHLVERLRSLVPIFRNKVKQQKKELKDRMDTVRIVNSNIARFIQYKTERVRKLR
ncbi:PREDICTED: HEAT repeat-containing protein 3 [Dinoponera quadriceps]|uniref:HEAT repeat-containing protein 3 n=1 Tax=Dinoponera quadriceps TaxID=609295 RepID=A0A6P3X1G0_DINQU|nr:PREDICTED: HEAT repeat-containing protein 3 [Dinoponera quadriceps]